jgi:hypothetical protein
MSALRIYKILIILIAISLFASACGSPPLDQAAMSTAVAQTVQAGASPTEAVTLPTNTSAIPDPGMTLTPVITPISAATIVSAPVQNCTASASLVGETYPDGTIVQPEETFTKVWQIQNSGTCIWDSSWQLIYSSGDLMDGLTVYNFPQPAQPGQTVDVPVILRAPAENGTYTGEWMLKSPWGQSFGVGQYSVPISVSIVVGSGTPENRKTETVFGVTAVTYEVERRCAPANTFYTITTHITSNGPIDVTFTWIQSDGNNKRNNQLEFTEATTKSAQREWSQHKDSSNNQRWAQVIVTSPTYQEFDKVVLPDLCPSD